MPGRAAPAVPATSAARRVARPAFFDAIRQRLTRRRVVLLLMLAVIAWQAVPRVLPKHAIPEPAGARSADGGAQAWGYTHGNASASRTTPAGAAGLTGAAAWSTPVAPLSAAAVADAHAIYLPLADGRLVALSRDDGHVLWTRANEYTLTAAPTSAEGRLYVLQRGGSLQALDAADGKVTWETEPLGAYGVAPVVVDGSVYLFFGLDNDGQETGLVAQVDAESGRVLWRGPASRAFPGIEMAVGSRSMAVIGGRTLEIYDRRYGERTFWFTFRYGPDAVAITGDVAYVVTAGETAAISLTASRPWWDAVRGLWVNLYVNGLAPEPSPVPFIWLIRHGVHEAFAPVIEESTVIVADRSGTIRAHDRASGAVRWSTGGAGISAAPVLTARGLLVARGGELSLLNPQSGSLIAKRTTGAEDDPIVQVIPTDAGVFSFTAAGVITHSAP